MPARRPQTDARSQPDSRYEREEYLEQDEEERESAGHRVSLMALAIMAMLVVAGIVLVDRLRQASAVQDCLMTRAADCSELVPIPASGAPSTTR